MASILTSGNFQSVTNIKDLARYVTNLFTQILKQANGNLDFVQNVRAAGPYPITFNVTNSDLTFAHSLSRSPTGFLIINSSVAMRVYQGVTPWTQSNITLRSDTVGVATLYVI